MKRREIKMGHKAQGFIWYLTQTVLLLRRGNGILFHIMVWDFFLELFNVLIHYSFCHFSSFSSRIKNFTLYNCSMIPAPPPPDRFFPRRRNHLSPTLHMWLNVSLGKELRCSHFFSEILDACTLNVQPSPLPKMTFNNEQPKDEACFLWHVTNCVPGGT